MKTALRLLLVVTLTLTGLVSCSNPFHNENDWAFNKSASPDHVPREVSRKVYH